MQTHCILSTPILIPYVYNCGLTADLTDRIFLQMLAVSITFTRTSADARCPLFTTIHPFYQNLVLVAEYHVNC